MIGFQNYQFQGVSYGLFVPHGYRASGPRYPLLVYLHGIKDSEGFPGEPLQRLKPILAEHGESRFPFFVLVPRCGRFPATWQAGGPDAARVIAATDHVVERYRLDPDRVILTGVSMGGFGTWSLAAAFPEKWAAIVPVCGGGDPTSASKIRHLPIWCFHGTEDRVVPVTFSRVMIGAVRALGGNPVYTEYPGVGHDSWRPAYRDPKLFEWMAVQQRGARYDENRSSSREASP